MARLKQIFGHDNVISSLLTLLEGAVLPHALLFHGLKGIGKRLTADHLAYALICGLKSPNKLEFDETSSLFPQIEAGSCSDYIVVEPEEGKKSIGIEQIRNMIKKLSLSSEGHRVIIIDSADQMTPEAANAILKNLEEPHPRTHFILIVHNISRLLPTIISRCRQFRFSPLSNKDTKTVLLKNNGNPDLAIMSAGSPGAALELSEDALQLKENFQFFMEQRTDMVALKILKSTQQKRNAPLAFELLLMSISEKARDEKELAKLYDAVNRRYKEMSAYNITPQLALEAALKDVVSFSSI